ncbi:MAG: hypothetical protein JSS02_16680 [Planctomycetes bacterium]|nr:hypothetical protein [Planctomycetota bacterium]
MSQLFLIRDLQGTQRFDARRVQAIMHRIQNESRCGETNSNYQCFCEYDASGDRTAAYMLAGENRWICIEGSGAASLSLALSIAQQYGAEMLVTDLDHVVEISPTRLPSVQDLKTGLHL